MIVDTFKYMNNLQNGEFNLGFCERIFPNLQTVFFLSKDEIHSVKYIFKDVFFKKRFVFLQYMDHSHLIYTGILKEGL